MSAERFERRARGYSWGMNDILRYLSQQLRAEDGFLAGRVALVVLIVAIIVIAALIAFLVPN